MTFWRQWVTSIGDQCIPPARRVQDVVNNLVVLLAALKSIRCRHQWRRRALRVSSDG